MDKESGFYSDAGDAFWDKTDPRLRSAMAEIIDEDCKKGTRVGIISLVFMFICIVFGVYLLMSGYSIWRNPKLLLMLFGPWIGFVTFGEALVKSYSYQMKSKRGMVLMSHVRVVNRKSSQGFTKAKFEVFLENDRGDMATVEVEKTFYDKVGVGICGWFAMLEGETKGIMVSPYWFIGDTDIRSERLPVDRSAATVLPSVISEDQSYEAPLPQGQFFGAPSAFVVSDSPSRAAVSTAGSTSSASSDDLFTAYFRARSMDVVFSSISAGLFLIGGLWRLIGSNAGFDAGIYGKVILAPYLMVLVACMMLQSRVRMHETSEGRKIALLYMVIQFFLNIFATLPVLPCDTGVRVAVSSFLMIFNLIMVVLMNKGLIDTCLALKQGRYRAMDGVLISKKQIYGYQYRICSCVVQVGSDTYDIQILPSQYKTYSEGMSGTMVTLDKDGSNLFLRV